MKCRHCGMESRTPQLCEWCRKPLADSPQSAPALGGPPQPPLGGGTLPPLPSPLNGPYVAGRAAAPLNAAEPPPLGTPYVPPPIMPIGPPPSARPLNAQGSDQTQQISASDIPSAAQQQGAARRVALTGEVVDDPGAAEPTLIGSVPPTSSLSGTTVMGTPPPVLTPYGLPVAAMTPQILRDQDRLLKPVRSWGESFELFLALAMPILLASLYLVHAAPSALMWVSIGDTVLLSLLMGATGAIPAFDDAYTDVAIILIVTFLLGPLVALIVHLVVGAMKQEWNGAVVGLLGLNLLISYGLRIAVFTSGTLTIQSFLMLGVVNSLIFAILNLVNVFFAFGAWMISGFFRPFEAT